MANEIRDFEKLLQPHLPPGEKILSYTTKTLTKPGENYGSLLLAVDVLLASGKTLNLVAKMCPPNDWIKNMFNIPVTFKKEANFYKVIVKTLREFQLGCGGVDVLSEFFAGYYGSRISLNANAQEVDDDAVLLLENLKVQGFEIGDRFRGFDRRATEITVVALARFHAIALALKIKQPEVFAENVRRFLPPTRGFSDISDEIKESLRDGLLEILRGNREIAPHLAQIAACLAHGQKAFEEGAVVREPFATIGHSDLWLNNVLLKPPQIKILDFQIINYASPARDLIFFLYTSVQMEIIEKHITTFIQIYHKTFIDTLTKFDCDVAPFNFDAFTEELKEEAKSTQLFHCLVMLSPIYAVNGAVKEVKDLTPEDMLSKERHENYEPKVVHTVLSFLKNGWL